ncbi:MAG: flagellar basal body P-ring formation protein FlgA [Gammaproteobacteria bacterium]|nr:flagellar basal body P-ring formation protein FlgA [Gammaproteobacteria bacterium]
MKKINLKGSLFVLIIGMSMTWSIFAAETKNSIESHKYIRENVAQFLTNKSIELALNDTNIEIGQLDHRMKLSKCATPLHLLMKSKTIPGNVIVSVGCTSGQAWKIYIQAYISAFEPVYVAKTSIFRGAHIDPDAVVLTKRNITSLHGRYITDLATLQGTIAKRLISKGQIISPILLKKVKLIKRGESVTILAESSGISVRMKGKALNDAAKGERVRVKNLNSKRIIEGIAVQRGHVKINLF